MAKTNTNTNLNLVEINRKEIMVSQRFENFKFWILFQFVLKPTHMAQIKNAMRNKLTSKNLENLLFLALNKNKTIDY